jgi:DNA-binding response OmpR family regulator
MNPKILIVEDEEAILKGLCDVFVFNNYEVETAMNGKEGLDKALTGNYHLILLDIMLPEIDGLTICNKIRQKDRSQPIIMLTAKGDEEDIIQGLKLGADDYIPKPFSVRELLARVEAVLRRSQKLNHSKAIFSFCNMDVDPDNLTLVKNEQVIELTRREVDILRYLMSIQERPVNRQELLKEVWGYSNTNMDTRTVDIHIAKLRKKIEDDAQEPKIITTVRGEGYKLMI